jgi:ethanolamine-phosphate cytidylyltransferase
MTASPEETIPRRGEWPVDPQDDVPIAEGRIWVDGCFDFSHHGRESVIADSCMIQPNHIPVGHAGAMLQARRLGDELLVGVHSDEAILENKGPTVMTLEER